MAISNHERVGKALELLREGLRPFVERELKTYHGDRWASEVKEVLTDTRLGGGKGDAMQDVAVQLVLMDRTWGDVFRKTLGKAERSLVNELLDSDGGCDPCEQIQSFSDQRALHVREDGDIAARTCEARDIAKTDRIDHQHEHHRDSGGRRVEGGERRRTIRDDEIRCLPDEFSRVVTKPPNIAARPAILDREVPSFRPAELVQALPEGIEARLPFRVVLADRHEHADVPHPLGLLRTR